MYENIPKAQLCIMPGETHFAPASNPKLFNEIVNRFLEKPFKRPDSDFTKW
jgi:pimeloyl-ACP methyl ester carboxylesterase